MKLSGSGRALLVALPLAAAFLIPGSAGAVGSQQLLAALNSGHEVYSSPRGHRVQMISAQRPITGEQTVLPVIGERTTRHPTRYWLHVRLPGRPNGLTGWIRQGGVTLELTTWHIVISTEQPSVSVYNNGRRVRQFTAIVGKPSTPTPHGEFFIEETIAEPPNYPGAPNALALSARSNVSQEFVGGFGQIAIHGIQNLPGQLGTAVSHGCIRLNTPDITWLAHHTGPGTPTTIQ